MRTVRIPAALCSAITVAALLAGCGQADHADDHNDSQRPTASASVKPVKPSQAETPGGNANELPPESDALKPGGGKNVEFEQKAIDYGTPDPCRLFTGRQYSRVLGYDKDMTVKSHGGGRLPRLAGCR